MGNHSKQIRLAIHGAAGRMGQRLVALGSANPHLKITAAIESASHPCLGEDAGTIAGVGPLGVVLCDTLPENIDVVIDFSVPQGTQRIVERCAGRGLPLVVATTGLDDAQQSQLKAASEQIPLLWSPNTSLAVNLAMKLSRVAAQSLADHSTGVDVEIIERHHRFKEDAPSGTALKFGELIAEAMGQTNEQHGRHGRPGERPHNEIGYHAVRIGDNPGEHTICFGMIGETVEVTVRATSRDCYALGALEAANFLHGKPPGMYAMSDVLGL